MNYSSAAEPDKEVSIADSSLEVECVCLKDNCKCRVRQRELYCSIQCRGGMSDLLHICDCSHSECFHAAA